MKSMQGEDLSLFHITCRSCLTACDDTVRVSTGAAMLVMLRTFPKFSYKAQFRLSYCS